MKRQALRLALEANKADLAGKSSLIAGRTLIKVMERVLSKRGAGFSTFLRLLPSRYDNVPKHKLRVVYTTTIAYLGNRANLYSGAVLLEFRTAGDERVRTNHAALNGFIFHPSHIRFNPKAIGDLIPPLGYNCRCVLVPVPVAKANRLIRAKGLKYYMTRKVPAGAYRDLAFSKKVA